MRSYSKHWALGMAEDVFRDRAEQQLSQSLTAARAYYDEVNVMLPDEFRNHFRNFALFNRFLVSDIVQRQRSAASQIDFARRPT